MLGSFWRTYAEDVMDLISVLATLALGLLVMECWARGTPPSGGASPITEELRKKKQAARKKL